MPLQWVDGNFEFEGHNKLVDVPDQLWKTLIAKKHQDGSDAEIAGKHACLAMLKRDGIPSNIDIRDLLHDPDFSYVKTKRFSITSTRGLLESAGTSWRPGG